jgi:hypothetical protein
MTLISGELTNSLIELNNKVLNNTIMTPENLAIALEEIATDAWIEARKRGAATWQDVEDIQPSIRIDP